jgi:hypothetical protein
LNLHITNDDYGVYASEIAKRIQRSAANNVLINFSAAAQQKEEGIIYISYSTAALEKYVQKVQRLDKLVFHAYHYNSYLFLNIVKRKFPKVKVYWVLWSSELYCQPPLPKNYYLPFSEKFIRERRSFNERLKELKIIGPLILNFSYLTGLKKNHRKWLNKSYWKIDFFCSLLPSDFFYFREKTGNTKAIHLPFAYLSLQAIMPDLNGFNSKGNKIMVGHSASPAGNHFEILERLNEINPQLPVFLPLAYGIETYGNIIEAEARKRFPNAEILRKKLDKPAYYHKLTEVGWSIINVRVQQALGNIVALIWMGVKIFLDEESSTYKDFKSWGIHLYSIQKELTRGELSAKLTPAQISDNKRIIFEKCNEETVAVYWLPILQ